MHKFIYCIFVIAEHCKPKCANTRDKVDKLWYSHIMEYCVMVKNIEEDLIELYGVISRIYC